MDKIYKDGHDSKWISWHENGNKKMEKFFEDGEEISGQSWDEDGNKI